MAGNTRELARLEKLPTEIIHAIANLLRPWEIKQFSCASKRLRQACLPTIFRHVKFEFSLDGIERLKGLLTSDVRSHVTSFTYEITELLNTELLDFSYFRSEILTPDGYVDMAKEMYDYAEDFPSYMSIYETVCDICKQQCSIIDEGADLLLSSVFCALPLLKEVSLYFCETLAFDHGPLNRDAGKDEPYQYHLEAVTKAIHNARRRGVAIHSIGLYALDFPDIHTGEEPSMAIVLKSLRRLLEDMIVLRLRGRECIFKLLSHGALGIHQLEMCGMQVGFIS